MLSSEGGLERIVEMSHDSKDCKDVPKFYKKDILAVLKEKNILKEQISSLEEELEEWKRSINLVIYLSVYLFILSIYLELLQKHKIN